MNQSCEGAPVRLGHPETIEERIVYYRTIARCPLLMWLQSNDDRTPIPPGYGEDILSKIRYLRMHFLGNAETLERIPEQKEWLKKRREALRDSQEDVGQVH